MKSSGFHGGPFGRLCSSGIHIMSQGSFRMSETNYPVTVSLVLEKQSSDVSTNVGLYVHMLKVLLP